MKGTPQALVPLEVGDWFAAEISLVDDNTLRIVFRERSEGDEFQLSILPRDAESPVFKRLQHCALRYTARIKNPTERRRAEVSALLLAVSRSIDDRLAAGGSIAEILGADRSPRRVVFGREMLREFLSPEFAEGVPAAGGFALHDIYPSSQRRLADQNELGLVIELRRGLRRVLFEVARASDRSALVRTQHFTVVELVGAQADTDGLDSLRALLSFVFRLRDHAGLDVVFPDVLSDLAVAALPAAPPPRMPGSLNLALDADCEQQCAFCSVKSANPAYDGGEAVLARAVADLTASRDRGIRHLRLNGYDPLAFSHVMDVLGAARDLGFDHVDVFSPCTRLADPAFCAEVLGHLPASRKIHVPLYATRAEAHDRFVGRAGAHALVMRAIDNLVTLAGADVVQVLTVITNENLGELPALHEWALARGLRFAAQSPYPMQEGRDDRFFGVVARQTDVAVAAVDLHRRLGPGRHELPLHGIMPCVMFRSFAAEGIAPWEWLLAGEVPMVPGSEYDREDIEHGAGERATGAFRVSTVTCPHAKNCALLPACGGSILRAYIEQHGSGEFQPVDLRTLIEATAPRRSA